jgi:DNA-directed RNA polymerase alpha subunit
VQNRSWTGYILERALTYNLQMARGWESKSVEAQQADASEKTQKPRTKLTPEAAAHIRERENLRLARQRLLQQLESSQNPRHQDLLRSALSDLDQKLKRLDG